MKTLETVESLVIAPVLLAQGVYAEYVHGALNACLWQLPQGSTVFDKGLGMAHNDRQDPNRQTLSIEQVGFFSIAHTIIDVTKGEFGRIEQIDAVRMRLGCYEHEVIGEDTLRVQEYKLESNGLSALGLIRTLQKIQRAARVPTVS